MTGDNKPNQKKSSLLTLVVDNDTPKMSSEVAESKDPPHKKKPFKSSFVALMDAYADQLDAEVERLLRL